MSVETLEARVLAKVASILLLVQDRASKKHEIGITPCTSTLSASTLCLPDDTWHYCMWSVLQGLPIPLCTLQVMKLFGSKEKASNKFCSYFHQILLFQQDLNTFVDQLCVYRCLIDTWGRTVWNWASFDSSVGRAVDCSGRVIHRSLVRIRLEGCKTFFFSPVLFLLCVYSLG